jgi:hypothetical protein
MELYLIQIAQVSIGVSMSLTNGLVARVGSFQLSMVEQGYYEWVIPPTSFVIYGLVARRLLRLLIV